MENYSKIKPKSKEKQKNSVSSIELQYKNHGEYSDTKIIWDSLFHSVFS